MVIRSWCRRRLRRLEDRHVGHDQVQRLGNGGDAQVADGGLPGPEQHRRDVSDDLVDQAGLEERRGQCRPALQEDVLAVERVELGEGLLRVLGTQLRSAPVVEDPSVGRQVAQPHHGPQRLPHSGRS